MENQSVDLPTNQKGRVQLPKIAIAAVVIGFFAGALTLVAAVQHVVYVLSAILPIAAGLSILDDARGVGTGSRCLRRRSRCWRQLCCSRARTFHGRRLRRL